MTKIVTVTQERLVGTKNFATSISYIRLYWICLGNRTSPSQIFVKCTALATGGEGTCKGNPKAQSEIIYYFLTLLTNRATCELSET